MTGERGGLLVILSLLLGLVVVLFFFDKVIKTYFKPPSWGNETIETTVSSTNATPLVDINTASYGSFLNSTRQSLKNVEGQMESHAKELEGMK